MNMIKKVNACARGLLLCVLIFNPGAVQAKDNDDQNEIILLNDSASALEDSNPQLSKELAQFADEREKEWEDKNADKDGPPVAVTDKNIKRFQDQIKLLKEAADNIQPTYPLIAQGLKKMAHEINRSIEIEK